MSTSARPVASTYSDPYNDLLNKLNRLAFWIGLLAPAYLDDKKHGVRIAGSFDPEIGTTLDYTVQGIIDDTTEVFRTDLRWFFGTAAVEATCIVCVATIYWGWWRLGREVSFSPLEIAKAFEAPLLRGVSSTGTGKQLARSSGQVIRYGAMANDAVGDGRRNLQILGFASRNAVYQPLENV